MENYMVKGKVIELPFDTKHDLTKMFDPPIEVDTLCKEFPNDCFGLALKLREIFIQAGVLAEYVTLKNGNAFSDGGILVNNKRYTHHTVVLMGEWVIDLLNSTKGLSTKKYIEKLERDNPKLRIDYTMSTYWYDNDGFPIQLTLEDLKNYKC